MKVANVRFQLCTHYIGRGSAPSGVQAQLGNPFFISASTPRAEVIRQFEAWARTQPEVMERIKALPADAVLGCWCAPSQCHGDAIMNLWDEMHNA